MAAVGPRSRQLAGAAVCLWAAGTVLSEAIVQVGAAACLLWALLHVRRMQLPRDVARYGLATLAFAAWQALSTVAARLSGVAEAFPRGSRYGLIADTVAPAGLAVVGQAGLPWVAIGGALAFGWIAAALFGALQHFAPSPIIPPKFVGVNVERVKENFGTVERPRFAAGGFMFHRLRLAHGAVAVIGPALVALSRLRQRARWVIAAVLCLALLAAPYLAFARAALVCVVGVAVAAGLLLARGTQRRWVIVAAVIGLGIVSLSPQWRARIRGGLENLAGGEREVAMRAGLMIALEHPLLGIGHGNYRVLSQRLVDDPLLNDRLAIDAHNLWLTVWAETGAVGVLLFGLSHGLLLVALWRRHRQGSPAATGAIVSLAVFHVLGLVHYLPFHISVHLTFALIWGLGLAPGSEALLRETPRADRSDGPAVAGEEA